MARLFLLLLVFMAYMCLLALLFCWCVWCVCIFISFLGGIILALKLLRGTGTSLMWFGCFCIFVFIGGGHRLK